MDAEQAKTFIEKKVSVTRQKVICAKAYILKNFNTDTEILIDTFLKSVEAPLPKQIVINDTDDTKSQLVKAGDAISWYLAACEGIWGLISNNLIVPDSSDLVRHFNKISYTAGGGRYSSGWSFDHLITPVPRKILLLKSGENKSHQPLSDPDLFLHDLNIENISEEVKQSLMESVRCFRYELYTACLAMLGRASEGAWIELGLALLKAIPENSSIDKNKFQKTIESPFNSIVKKISEVQKVYENTEIFKQIYDASKVKPALLKNTSNWSDVVRDSRNSIHYGVESAMPNSYEKVAALLIGAVPHLKYLYSIIKVIPN